ncbi:pilus assembly protein [Promicromonospora sp. NPDC052451]|uniref:pilus assembly protein n=1 Tax=Promicromonospora sp. NPDC052451 TaxID=3364407 RepID=UPI0037C8D2ED
MTGRPAHPGPWARRLRDHADESGSAMVEFLGVTLILLVPLVYLVMALGRVQAGAFAAEGAAREAVRAMVTAESSAAGTARADIAAGIALADQGFPRDAGALTLECSDSPCLTPGGTVGAVVRVEVPLPLVPELLSPWLPLAVPVEAARAATVDAYTSVRP